MRASLHSRLYEFIISFKIITCISKFTVITMLITDGKVAGGSCDQMRQCDGTLNLMCVSDVNAADSVCQCMDTYYADNLGNCVDSPPGII